MRATFEEACKASHAITTSENFLTLGVEETMRRNEEKLQSMGWTQRTLTDEAGRRMRERIAAMKALDDK